VKALFTAETPRTQRIIIFPLAGDAAKGKPLIASRTLNPPKATGSFIKSASPDFMKNKLLRVLSASAVKMFF
jgi:hypothetical protein